MTPQQAARVLALACTFDPRLNPPSPEDAKARSVAWSAALHPDMAPEWAESEVLRHYQSSTEAIMPATLNASHRAYRARILATRDNAARRLQQASGVPMPDDFRQRALGGRHE